MARTPDRRLALSLALLRLSTGAFFLVWASEKILAPEVARRVFETFYFSSPSDASLLATGILQAIVVLAFMAGLFRFWTYGALLAMHTVSVASTLPRLVDPFTPPNHLFWAAVPLLALLLVLFLLRERDTLLVLPAPAFRGARKGVVAAVALLAPALLVLPRSAAADVLDADEAVALALEARYPTGTGSAAIRAWRFCAPSPASSPRSAARRCVATPPSDEPPLAADAQDARGQRQW